MENNPGYYASLLEYSGNVPCPSEHQIDLDLKRTFPNEKKCMEKLYHPKKFIQLQRQIVFKCSHSGCNKKISINEFPCCHQQNLGEGCLMSDGNHILSVH